jgi:hypothetical protein
MNQLTAEAALYFVPFDKALEQEPGGIIMKRMSCAALMLLAPALGQAEVSMMGDEALSQVNGQAIITLAPGIVGSTLTGGVYNTYTVFDQTLYVPYKAPTSTTPTPGPGHRPIIIGNFVCDTCLIVEGIKLGLVASYIGAEASVLALDPFPIGQSLAALHYSAAVKLNTVAGRLFYGP